jgi:hypothetical protein
VDGGPNYLQQFAFPLAAGRFPIGVWLECAVDPQAVATDRGAGLDIYTALCANQAELANARDGGMRVFFQDEWLGRMPTDAVNAGYMVGDEWDMTRGPTACLNGDWQAQINHGRARRPRHGIVRNPLRRQRHGHGRRRISQRSRNCRCILRYPSLTRMRFTSTV